MSIARLNFSHATHEFAQEIVTNIQKAREITKKNIAILGDLRNAEIRLGYFKNGLEKVSLTKGQTLRFHSKPVDGDENDMHIEYADVHKHLKVGDKVVLNYNAVGCTVTEVTPEVVTTIVDNDSVMMPHKIVHLVDGETLLPVPLDINWITEKDKKDIEFAITHGFDFICTTAQRANDIKELKNTLHTKKSSINVFVKVDRSESVHGFDEMLKLVDGVIIARSSIAMVLPLEDIAHVQKSTIRKCNFAGKPVIVTNQIINSMITNPRPTRAEVTDIANAVFDGVDGFALTNTTAEGLWPVRSVKIVLKQCYEVEKVLKYRDIYHVIRHQSIQGYNFEISFAESMASSAVKTAWDLDATLLIALSENGDTARFVSKYRPHCPIMAVTTKQEIANSSLASFGVVPYVIDEKNTVKVSMLDVIKQAIIKAKELELVQPGEHIVAIAGDISLDLAHKHEDEDAVEGVIARQTNMIQVVQVV
jgi:pyruvate kinase